MQMQLVLVFMQSSCSCRCQRRPSAAAGEQLPCQCLPMSQPHAGSAQTLSPSRIPVALQKSPMWQPHAGPAQPLNPSIKATPQQRTLPRQQRLCMKACSCPCRVAACHLYSHAEAAAQLAYDARHCRAAVDAYRRGTGGFKSELKRHCMCSQNQRKGSRRAVHRHSRRGPTA